MARRYQTPDDLKAACVSYFEWVEANPLYEEKHFAFQGAITKSRVPKLRAMTVAGMCLHIGLTVSGWNVYEKREEYSPVCDWARSVIYEQKFTGAAAGLLEPMFIARDLGLSDKQEVAHTGDDSAETNIDLDTARRLAFLLTKGELAATKH